MALGYNMRLRLLQQTVSLAIAAQNKSGTAAKKTEQANRGKRPRQADGRGLNSSPGSIQALGMGRVGLKVPRVLLGRLMGINGTRGVRCFRAT